MWYNRIMENLRMEEKLGAAIGGGTALERGVSEVIDMSKYGDIMYAKGKADMNEYVEIKEAQGELRGERKKAIESAKNFIKMGVLTIEQIAQGLGLAEEDVIEAKNKLNEK